MCALSYRTLAGLRNREAIREAEADGDKDGKIWRSGRDLNIIATLYTHYYQLMDNYCDQHKIGLGLRCLSNV